MQSTTEFSRGDVVLVNFVFADETGSKRRPVLLISSDEYMQGGQEVLVSAITSNTRRILIGDHLMVDWEDAGLLFPSVVTGILRTMRQNMIQRKMGTISQRDFTKVESNLKLILELNL